MPHHTEKEEICDVAGCDKPSERSLNIKKVSETDLKLKSDSLKQVHLCKEHYKQLKKQTKNDIPDYMG
jgi:ribosomal protein L14E/L6E/L27E